MTTITKFPGPVIIFFCGISVFGCRTQNQRQSIELQPNILFAIADDQAFPHASAYGMQVFPTPAFDKVAGRGILFTNAFVAAPQCSPSRAAILTGRNLWQLEEAGTHSSYFPKKFPVFTDALFDSYPRFGRMRPFDGFRRRGEYNKPFGGEENGKRKSQQ